MIILAISALFPVLIACASILERDPDVYYLLPRESDLPGWEMTEGPRRFDKTNMALYGGTDSDLLKEYGVLACATALYGPLGDDRKELRVWVYKFGSPLMAFGFYGRKSQDITGLPAPSLGSHEITAFQNGLLLRKGVYLVSIITDGSEAGEELMSFARSIMEEMPSSEPGLPDWIDAFAPGGKNGRVLYYPSGLYGIHLEGGVFVRKWAVHEKDYEVFYSRRQSPASALRDFTGLLDAKNGGLVLLSSSDGQLAFGQRQDGGHVFAARWEDYIFGIVRAETLADGKNAVNKLLEEISSGSKK